MTAAARVMKLLGGPDVLRAKPKTDLDFIAVMREGLPFGALQHTIDALDIPLTEASRILRLNLRTLSRRKHSARLSQGESERVLRLARVAARASEVFRDTVRARAWLREPVRALGSVAPMDLLDTDIGTAHVLDVLGRIEWGVYS